MHELVTLLEKLGFLFELDWDEELIVTPPEDLDVPAVMAQLEGRRDALQRHVSWRASRAKRVLVGGPLAGRAHAAAWYNGGVLFYHLARARWAVYVVANDGRAWYVGEAASEKKAKLLGQEKKHGVRAMRDMKRTRT